MIHRWLTRMAAFDAMFLAAVATAAYVHTGHIWLMYAICIMGVVTIFRLLKDVSTWSDQAANASNNIAREINFLARCVRDHE